MEAGHSHTICSIAGGNAAKNVDPSSVTDEQFAQDPLKKEMMDKIDKELQDVKNINPQPGAVMVPRLACPDPALSTARKSKRTNRSVISTNRSASIGASTERDIIEMEQIEDQLWEIQQKIEWKKAQQSLNNHERLQKSSNAATWATNGRDVYMANRYRSQAMDTYGGYNSDVFTKATFTTKHQRVRKEFGRYGEALHLAKTTMRGNF